MGALCSGFAFLTVIPLEGFLPTHRVHSLSAVALCTQTPCPYMQPSSVFYLGISVGPLRFPGRLSSPTRAQAQLSALAAAALPASPVLPQRRGSRPEPQRQQAPGCSRRKPSPTPRH